MTEIIRTSYLRTDAVRFVTNALVGTYGSAEGYNVETAVDELAALAGGYDTFMLTGDEFWSIVNKHEVDPEPEIEAYRVTLKSVLDGSFRDMIIDDSHVDTIDDALNYVNGIVSSAWDVFDVQEIPAGI